jgi:hypothetical protein
MFSRHRFLAGASAVALAAGTTLAGAGIASAQDEEESTGSLSSSSIGDIGGDFETAAEALNGPVTVSPNEEGGPTITYTNETGAAQECLGFTAPYSTIIEDGLDTDYDPDDVIAALELMNDLEDGGDVSLFGGDEEGAPIAFADPNPDEGGDVAGFVAGFALGLGGQSLGVAADGEVSWTAPTPNSPALAVVICLPEGGGDRETYNGIDPQVVADQINGRIPGGSVEIVSPDMISGGSVETGATLLGSLGDAGDDTDDGDGDIPVETVE